MDPALQTMINNMPEKTGKSLEEWKKILNKNPFEKHGQAVKFLKTEFGVTHGFANTIVHLFKEAPSEGGDLVSAQFQGKEVLKPIYDELEAFIKMLGDDVNIVPKKTSVSFVRKKQFALTKPATKTRLDLGLKLVGTETTDRLGNSGPFGTMCTHRVQMTETGQLDDELKGWLKDAYERAN